MLHEAGAEEHDREVWAETLDEIERGVLRGPFSLQEARDRSGPRFVPAPRFGVKQGGSYRPIDDFGVNGQNDCVSMGETVDPAASTQSLILGPSGCGQLMAMAR